MAISNEWQNVDNLVKINVDDSTNQVVMTIWDGDSVQKIADAIGWERVHLSDYFEYLTIEKSGYTTYQFSTAQIYAIRPISEDAYSNVIIPFLIQSNDSINSICYIVSLSGQSIVWMNMGSSSLNNNVMVLRPSAQGCFCIKYFRNNNVYYAVFDRYLNPKTNATKWGLITNVYLTNIAGTTYSYAFVDLSTALYFSPSYKMSILTPSTRFYPYIALKKFTAISSSGIFNANILYSSYIDYAQNERTIEVDGDRYRCIPIYPYSDGLLLYIPLD